MKTMDRKCAYLCDEAKSGLEQLKQRSASEGDLRAYMDKAGCRTEVKWRLTALEFIAQRGSWFACQDHVVLLLPTSGNALVRSTEDIDKTEPIYINFKVEKNFTYRGLYSSMVRLTDETSVNRTEVALDDE